MMNRMIEAIFEEGVFKPESNVDLREHQRVRLLVEPIDRQPQRDRAAAMKRLRTGISSMNFVLKGMLPSRDELHERG